MPEPEIGSAKAKASGVSSRPFEEEDGEQRQQHGRETRLPHAAPEPGRQGECVGGSVYTFGFERLRSSAPSLM